MSTSKTKKPRKQQIIYTTAEDIAICEAHLAITSDGSVTQKSNRYWDRIIPLFVEKTKGKPNGREKDSLENRICAIKKM